MDRTTKYIRKGVQRINNENDKRVILNDFHLLPTSGHAGIRRISNNKKVLLMA